MESSLRKLLAMQFRAAFLVWTLFAISYFRTCAGACLDTLTDCPKYTRLCGSESVAKVCKKSCNLCLNDPCAVDNGGCNQLCRKGTCVCYPGFKLGNDGKTCVDIDECTEGPDPCFVGLAAHCVNEVGRHTCQPYKCSQPGEMNYYKSPKCCKATNGACGTTASIRDRYIETRNENLAVPTVKRVFGGVAAVTSAWPWMVQLVTRGSPHCGGALITSRWVVSAAHCFGSSINYKKMFVYLGQIRSATNLNEVDSTRRVQRTIDKLIVHANYSSTFHNDIALLRLNEEVQSNEIINPVCLPCGEIPEVGTKCWVTGFGLTENSGTSGSATLQEVDVPIVNSSKCALAYIDDATIDPDKMICAGYEQGKKDACQGDSGGPLVCQRKTSCEWFLTGVVSFGKGCARAGYYGVYTNVINYEGWIRQQLGTESANLCTKVYDACRGLSDLDPECMLKLGKCTAFPHYMETNCKLTCCKLRNKEISDCYDESDSAFICNMYKDACHLRSMADFMKKNCRKTCNLC